MGLFLFIPYTTSSNDNYTRDEEVLLMPPKVYQRNLNMNKNKKEEKPKKSQSRRKWK